MLYIVLLFLLVNFCCYSAVHTMMFWTGQKHVTGKFENSISLTSGNFTTPTGTQCKVPIFCAKYGMDEYKVYEFVNCCCKLVCL